MELLLVKKKAFESNVLSKCIMHFDDSEQLSHLKNWMAWEVVPNQLKSSDKIIVEKCTLE